MKASTFFTVSFNIINVPKYINFFNNVHKCDKKTVVFFILTVKSKYIFTVVLIQCLQLVNEYVVGNYFTKTNIETD